MNQDVKNIHTPLWEKVIGGIGFVMLCIGFVYLIWSAVTEQKHPPRIDFNVKETIQLGEYFHVQIEVVNSGAQTVAGLHIEGALKGAYPEVSTGEIDYIPPQSTREVGLYFTSDPRLGELVVRPIGYQKP